MGNIILHDWHIIIIVSATRQAKTRQAMPVTRQIQEQSVCNFSCPVSGNMPVCGTDGQNVSIVLAVLGYTGSRQCLDNMGNILPDACVQCHFDFTQESGTSSKYPSIILEPNIFLVRNSFGQTVFYTRNFLEQQFF